MKIFLLNLYFKAKPLSGKVAKILTWRWMQTPEEKAAIKDEDSNNGTTRKSLKGPRQREYFVKWCDKSYWHCDWVSELQVSIIFNFIII